jgi:predicted acylesterase/phospholipase RssA/MinD-like ATPase involved in chromosome partitioning or flagellar assembly
MIPNREQGKIITFYSYKGGTGRSMALANTAWILASSGKRVLAVDWDLEAPGLHRYFYPFLIDKNLDSTEGVIDLAQNYTVAAMSPLAGESTSDPWYLPQANILRYTASLKWEHFKEGGRLDFISAGRQGPSYAARLNTFSWQNFYERLGGSAFLDEVRSVMKAEYDYVLIDSRTGVSDTSGICTIKMPDILVVCFTLNNQSIDGASSVASSVFEMRASSGINIFPVPMRIDQGEQKKLEQRTEYARDKFAGFPNYIANRTRDDYWNDVPVLYVTYYAYEEILAAFGQKDRKVASLLASLERLTSYLSDGAVTRLEPPPDERREEILALYEGRPAKVDPLEKLDKVADAVLGRLTPDEQVMGRRVLLRLVRVARPEEVSGHARQRVSLNDFDSSTRQVIQILCEAQLLTLEQDTVTGEEMIQISQDALVQKWKQLQSWIEEERSFLIWRQELQPLATRWKRETLKGSTVRYESASKDPSLLLLRGITLDEAKYWLRKHRADLSQGELEFIQASLDLNEIEREVERLKPAAQGKPSAEHTNQRRPVPRPRVESENVTRAKEILQGLNVGPDEMFKLAKNLKRERAFGYTRRLLSRIRKSQVSDLALWRKITQQYALCTYKDPDLSAELRLDRALQILKDLDDLSKTTDQETLGLTGAIFKRKWELYGQKPHLERSYAYYQRGYAAGDPNSPDYDFGYTGINAAFVQDLLANQEEKEASEAGIESVSAITRRAEAKLIRERLVATLPALMNQPGREWLENEWWFLVTIAESYFGLGRYTDALPWLKRAAQLEGVPEWERESTLRQLAHIARLHDKSSGAIESPEYTEAWDVLTLFLGNNVAAVGTAYIGKVGLALSGGGFRASLFHIGVLAKLAELDALRHIEVLSCVSGGSIIGAHYYLEVRNLLQTRPDEKITREDYIEIVKRIEKEFLAGVQRNIRTRVAAGFGSNLKMIFAPNYSRTTRAGELYEKEIFSRVPDGEGNEPRYLCDLFIQPQDVPYDFNPKYDNWRRAAKVPILILNATTLNTGHNWQFTASWMGEPPAGINIEVDGNDRLRRMYYEDAPEQYRKFPLGAAVAASACVPGVFEPLVLTGLYPERTVRLVDGGVQDNQGVAGLIEQDCTLLLVSDASGQTGSEKAPGSGTLSVLLRASNVSQARLREAQYTELEARRRSSLLRGLMFIHLKKDLDVDPVDWIGSVDPFDSTDEARPVERRGPLTSYGIRKDAQQFMAATRTDLDSFSEIEAYALMSSGYSMTDRFFSECIKDFPRAPSIKPDWEFLILRESLRGGVGYKELLKLLKISNVKGFKAWKLSRTLRIFMRGLLFVAAVMLVVATVMLSTKTDTLLMIKDVVWSIIVPIVLLISAILFMGITISLLGKRISMFAKLRDNLEKVTIGVFLSTLGFPLALLHLYFFDKIFLGQGLVERVIGYRRPAVTRREGGEETEQTGISASG